MQFTPRAMLEIGELYLRGGTVDGMELVSREWIRVSLVPQTQSRFSRRHYGYGWWLRTLAGFPTYYAWGYGGQFIFVIPDLNAVIVATSSPLPGEGRRSHRRGLDALIECQLIPEIARARRMAEWTRLLLGHMCPMDSPLTPSQPGTPLRDLCHESPIRDTSVTSMKYLDIWPVLHSAWRRCSSLKYVQYSRSLRLASRPHHRPRCLGISCS